MRHRTRALAATPAELLGHPVVPLRDRRHVDHQGTPGYTLQPHQTYEAARPLSDQPGQLCQQQPTIGQGKVLEGPVAPVRSAARTGQAAGGHHAALHFRQEQHRRQLMQHVEALQCRHLTGTGVLTRPHHHPRLQGQGQPGLKSRQASGGRRWLIGNSRRPRALARGGMETTP